MRYGICVLLFWLNVSVVSQATEVNVRYEDETYFLSAEFDVEATPMRVMEVLTDFENISDLNPAIIESEIQDSSQVGSLRVKTVVQDCILFFCKSITRVEDLFKRLFYRGRQTNFLVSKFIPNPEIVFHYIIGFFIDLNEHWMHMQPKMGKSM